MSKGIYYNYDLEECNWLFKHGIKPIGCGKHEKTGNTFIIFLINKKYNELDQQYKEERNNTFSKCISFSSSTEKGRF